jgi:hypothetical protein
MADLATTSLTAGTALLGNFAQGLAFVVRSDLALEIVRFGKPTSACMFWLRMPGLASRCCSRTGCFDKRWCLKNPLPAGASGGWPR